MKGTIYIRPKQSSRMMDFLLVLGVIRILEYSLCLEFLLTS